MDLASGVFTAPLDGIYHFEFSGITNDISKILLQVNGYPVALTTDDLSFTNENLAHFSLSFAISLQLDEGDRVNLYKIGDGTLGEDGTLMGAPSTHFTGWLVEEVLKPVSINRFRGFYNVNPAMHVKESSLTRAAAPSSCNDLSKIGYTLAAYYLISNFDDTTSSIQAVYCDFGTSGNLLNFK